MLQSHNAPHCQLQQCQRPATHAGGDRCDWPGVESSGGTPTTLHHVSLILAERQASDLIEQDRRSIHRSGEVLQKKIWGRWFYFILIVRFSQFPGRTFVQFVPHLLPADAVMFQTLSFVKEVSLKDILSSGINKYPFWSVIPTSFSTPSTYTVASGTTCPFHSVVYKFLRCAHKSMNDYEHKC